MTRYGFIGEKKLKKLNSNYFNVNEWSVLSYCFGKGINKCDFEFIPFN